MSDSAQCRQLLVPEGSAAETADSDHTETRLRYTNLQPLPLGGANRVFAAIDRQRVGYRNTNPNVSLFFLPKALSDNAQAVASTLAASRAWLSIGHPALLKADTLQRQNGRICVATDPVCGAAFVRSRWLGLRVEERAIKALDIINRLGEVLIAAHAKGLLHGNLSRFAFYIYRDGRAKLLDPGLTAILAIGSNETAAGSGTTDAMAYRSTEALRADPVDARSDVFSLACISYELLTGKHPFKGMTAQAAQRSGYCLEAAAGLSAAQFSALQRALAYDVNARTPSVRNFLAELNPRAERRVNVYAVLTALASAGGAAVYFLN